MSQPLTKDANNFDKNVKLEEILNNPDDSDIGYFVEVHIKNPDEMKPKTKNVSYCPVKKISPKDKFSKQMKINLINIL